MRRALQVTGLLILLLAAVAIGLLARLRGRERRFERARIDRVEDAVTPLQRSLFDQGCSSVRVVPMNQSMVTGPHTAGALWIECWSEAPFDQLLERLPLSTWPAGSDIRFERPGSWSHYIVQNGRVDLIGASNMRVVHAGDPRSRRARFMGLVRALFQ